MTQLQLSAFVPCDEVVLVCYLCKHEYRGHEPVTCGCSERWYDEREAAANREEESA